MPAIREHDILYTDPFDDDDGMPPLVDNPNPSMTFTFFTDMTPITAFTADPTLAYDATWDTTSPPSLVDFPEHTEATLAAQTHPRISHGKKRDASYIPRPPNAFILFRSSFIRSQQVPGKVEGNHSTLSKIIGKYWKTLPREEREHWEAKALVAQTEHRRKYPDWRFRPGANALAKLKVKDGPGTTTNRRRHSQTNRKGRGEAEVKEKSREERCTKIADLLVEGKKGIDLEDAVKKWEHDLTQHFGVKASGEKCREVEKTLHVGLGGDNSPGNFKEAIEAALEGVDTGLTSSCVLGETKDIYEAVNARAHDEKAHIRARCKTPDAIPDSRFKVPLTAMFRRSLSAPAAHNRDSYPSLPLAQRHVLDEPISSIISDTATSPSSFPADRRQEHKEGQPRVVHAEAGSLSPLVLPSLLGESPARWNDSYNLFDVPMSAGVSSDCPGLAYDLSSPSVSPLESSFSVYNFPSPPLGHMVPKAAGSLTSQMTLDGSLSYPVQSYSPYSSLKGWDTAELRDFSRGPLSAAYLPPYSNCDSQLTMGGEGVGAAPTIYEWSPFDDTLRSRDIHSLHQYNTGLEAFDLNDVMRIRSDYFNGHYHL
ncbi:hypothetical protein SERLA73DRAFT_69833 [Serpula lacrymans var. lacrymans S7.3]|uniref:HMG box domain-containing protein n=2 Tax=Serpula lacrymans var. lacrymans TaxID=341189 RepID=F8PIU3_SERL3|nr:uncharacterized protein SERLADRAFT_433898 [Serpula lacrymans var. lacrymans S7.9]EGO04043.1 hypothetical protein SERLA73DRAFT_69833 [Serpula lacrymans var. lacrymans S7.3]EGO29960.1 hypothetical protein SERLADRAFT_433898 [Serpula lacrymans var. lacrymans S7.9]